MQNTNHLTALHSRLLNEKYNLSRAKTPSESKLRAVYVSQIEQEIKDEMLILGITLSLSDLSDDDILKDLGL